jgi:hypothetical protein
VKETIWPPPKVSEAPRFHFLLALISIVAISGIMGTCRMNLQSMRMDLHEAQLDRLEATCSPEVPP